MYETLVRQIFKDVLGVSSLDDHDDFFGLGGQSLLAMRVVRRVETECDVKLSPTVLFDHPTVQGLADEVRAARAS